MEKNEIKKLLYIHKPTAKFTHIRKGHAFYKANVVDTEVIFDIPVIDMGDADFFAEMEAKLLVRWIL